MLTKKQIVPIDDASALASPIDLNELLSGLSDKKIMSVTFTNGVFKTSIFITPLAENYTVNCGVDTFDVTFVDGIMTFTDSTYSVSDIIMYNDYVAVSEGEDIAIDNISPFVLLIDVNGKSYEISDMTMEHFIVTTDGYIVFQVGPDASKMLVF